MKYNVVLIPATADASNTLVQLARAVSIDNQLTPHYLLKSIDADSIPHISVFQFQIDSEDHNTAELLKRLEQHITDAWQLVLANFRVSEVVLTLPDVINYKHDTAGVFTGISWSAIVINKAENPILQFFHDRLCEKLTSFGITCVNAHGEKYNPHFTLFNISSAELEAATLIRTIPDSYRTKLRALVVQPALGIANNNWELTKKLFSIRAMFPRELIENFLQGYTAEEIGEIKQDLEALTRFSFNRIPPHINASTSPMYIATAGGPGLHTPSDYHLSAHMVTSHFQCFF